MRNAKKRNLHRVLRLASFALLISAFATRVLEIKGDLWLMLMLASIAYALWELSSVTASAANKLADAIYNAAQGCATSINEAGGSITEAVTKGIKR